MPDRAVFEETYWLAYRNINQRFALKTIEALTSLPQVKLLIIFISLSRSLPGS